MGLIDPNYFDSAVLDHTTASALPKCSHPCYPINDLSAKLKTALTLDPDGPSACPTLVRSLPIQPETDSVHSSVPVSGTYLMMLTRTAIKETSRTTSRRFNETADCSSYI